MWAYIEAKLGYGSGSPADEQIKSHDLTSTTEIQLSKQWIGWTDVNKNRTQIKPTEINRCRIRHYKF